MSSVEDAICDLPHFPDITENLLTETDSQRRWLLERDETFQADWLVEHPKYRGETELTHIISPRAILWGIIHLSANHGIDIFDGQLETSLDTITEYTQIKDTFFPWFLQNIRLSAQDNSDDFYAFATLPLDDDRVARMIKTIGGVARLIYTDPRNILVTTDKFNNVYTSGRRTALAKYRKGDRKAYVQMEIQHEILAEQGEVSALIHIWAEIMQEKALERTRTADLLTYPNTARRESNKSITYDEMLQLAIELNATGWEPYLEIHQQTLSSTHFFIH